MAKADTTNKRPAEGEATRRQSHGQGDVLGTLMELPGFAPTPAGSYQTYRKMLEDPTIALARATVMGPIMAGSWAFNAMDDTPEDRFEFIREIIEPMRRHIVATALKGGLDFGWQGWEKVFRLEDGRLALSKLKPLLHELTKISIDRETGRFEGFRQKDVIVPLEKALLYTHDREGDNYYGRPRLENCRRPWDWWNQTNDAAARYDRKVAGAQFVVHYPPGKSIDKDGQLRDNYEIAQRLLNSIAAGKGIAVPNEFASMDDERNASTQERRKWLIEILEDRSPRQGSFIERLRYLDALKMRGYLRSERSALEANSGGIGTSDTEDMQDLGLTDGDLLHQDIVEVVNWHVVDQLLALNFGEEARGSVWVTASPLRDSRLSLFREVLREWAKSPDGREDLRVWLDFDSILDMSEAPKAAETVDSAGGDAVDDEDDPDRFTGPLADQMRNIMATSNAERGAEGQVGDSGIATSQGLNGAQITAALAVLDQLKAGSITPEQAIALLLAMGIDEDKARRIIGGERPAGE